MTKEEAMYCMRAHMEYPKSLCTRCKYRYATQPCEVRTAHKMAADALAESSMIDRVLEIIDEADDENRNEVGVVQNDDMDNAYAIIYERVSALKGGGKE